MLVYELNSRALLLCGVAAMAMAFAAAPLAARATESQDAAGEIEALRAETQAAYKELDAQRAELNELRQELRNQSALLRRAGLGDANSLGRVNEHSIIRIADQSAPVPAPVNAASAERPRPVRQADQLLVDAGGVLLPRWTLQVEPSLTETHVSNPRVNIFGYTV